MAVFIWSRVTLVMSALIRNVHLMSDGWWGTSITDNSPSLVILVAVIYTRIMFCLHEIVQVSAWYRPHYICLGSLWQVDMTTAASCSVWLQGWLQHCTPTPGLCSLATATIFWDKAALALSAAQGRFFLSNNFSFSDCGLFPHTVNKPDRDSSIGVVAFSCISFWQPHFKETRRQGRVNYRISQTKYQA